MTYKKITSVFERLPAATIEFFEAQDLSLQILLILRIVLDLRRVISILDVIAFMLSSEHPRLNFMMNLAHSKCACTGGGR